MQLLAVCSYQVTGRPIQLTEFPSVELSEPCILRRLTKRMSGAYALRCEGPPPSATIIEALQWPRRLRLAVLRYQKHGLRSFTSELTVHKDCYTFERPIGSASRQRSYCHCQCVTKSSRTHTATSTTRRDVSPKAEGISGLI